MIVEYKPEVVPLTVESAKAFSELPCFGGDRDREKSQGKKRIAFLYNQLVSGNFHSPDWATVLFHGKLHRLNGGHSSLMLSEANGATSMVPKWVMIRRFYCDTDHEFASLFSRFDQRASMRTMNDKVNAHKFCEDGVRDLSSYTVLRAIRGVAFYFSGCGEERPIDEDGRVALIHEHSDFIAWSNNFLGTTRLGHAGLVAAMYETWLHDRRTATQFWVEVRDETGRDPRGGSRQLAKFIRENSGRLAPGHRKWTMPAFYVKAIHAANAWLTDEPTTLRYSPKAALPRLKW